MKVMVYGAGKRGKAIVQKWREDSECEIIGFYDKEKTGTTMGLPVVKYENGSREIPVLISLANFDITMSIANNLRDAGYHHIAWYHENPYMEFFQGQWDDMGTWGDAVLRQAEIHLSDACNLNCRGCTHFSPLFHHIDADLEEKLADVRKLAGKVSHIVDFYLLGGEPFLNPEIGAYVKGIRRLLPQTRLTVVTNGLLIPKLSQDVLDVIRENQVIISISEYQPTHEIIGDITRTLENAGVKYTLRPYDSKQLFNRPIELHPSGKYPLKCISNGCVNLYKGTICRCPTLMYAFKFNEAFGAHLPTEGIMNLDDAPSGAALVKKLKEPVPLCKHCVENSIPWGRCDGKPSLDDFAARD